MIRPRGGSLQLACCFIHWLILCCTPLRWWYWCFGQAPSPSGIGVSLCLTSPSAVQTSFPVQLGGPQQVAAPPARPATGLVLSPDCRPIPAKLVKRSLSGQFVEMRDFLMDNVKLVDRFESTGLQPGSMVRPRMREVSSRLAWICCFLAYAAIRCREPFTRDMLAYARGRPCVMGDLDGLNMIGLQGNSVPLIQLSHGMCCILVCIPLSFSAGVRWLL